ncbi:DctP family TRAP transporter solute-binding subunit [Rhodobacter sphaeroides]|jgi:C4-dicarboxylate-binding protein DctP|uniref:TRAP-T family transporter, C4-dicarboxylate-binding protein DctP n=2 Tax=Cereibacter sphaeroides TaxID=1063 RepID=Q3IZE2_CERS4|nr:TRAP transporter substrate-binding protein [Cereibacter sphaeroides]ABN77671.1 TRAP dicarboxylate transporter, DctP subunit [Cereibacter sphaeroides ATCC 17029]EKX56599.1 TRAP-type C4-dicarboxylate transport system, periplasmic component [Rhodobacter sp. AKP1]ABA80092.1 TRAP-T family transporter, C4-dicarboxylate-binding protein DctP [Cereibacter sphaeroides 2.4.1]ACM02142.1 C4-dicarboxylate binding-protein precursor [Cereibacter sphaeroides KD131]AMJ48340.1 C4-dicarboxylate ABC transporter
MLTRRSLAALAGAAALALAAAVPALAQPIVIKFSHVVAPDTPKGKGATKFEELAEKYTDGAVDVEVYPNSQLYKDKEELEALQLGAVQMLAPSLAKFGPLGVQDFEVFDLPYIFKGYDALHTVTNGEVGKMLFSKLEDKGIKGLAYWDNGFKIMSANSPIATPDDFLGLKMRIQSSKVLEAQMNALGAVPQVMAFSEVYQALQTGVVDGTENPPSNMYTQKMHEVQKHATVSNHGYLGYAVIVNKQFWDGLPEEVRAGLEKALTEATDYANGIAKEENDKALQAMKDAGTTEFHELTPEELAAWEEVLAPVHEEMAGRIGAETIAAVKAATGTN